MEEIIGQTVETGTRAADGATGRLNSTEWGAVLVVASLFLAVVLAAIGVALYFGGRFAAEGIRGVAAWVASFADDVKERHFSTVDQLTVAVDKQADAQAASVDAQQKTNRMLAEMRRECVEGHQATHKLVESLVQRIEAKEGTA